MTYYIYSQPVADASDKIHFIMSDEAILADYWWYWQTNQTGKVFASRQEAERECVQEFCRTYKAVPVTLDELSKRFNYGQ